ERLRLMQPEAAGRQWGPAQAWPSALPEEDHSTTWIAERASEWLGKKRKEPFFAWVSFCDPHHPMDAPEPWGSLYQPKDVVEVLPKVAEGELQQKPKLHLRCAQGSTEPTLRPLNPCGGNLKPVQLAAMI